MDYMFDLPFTTVQLTFFGTAQRLEICEANVLRSCKFVSSYELFKELFILNTVITYK